MSASSLRMRLMQPPPERGQKRADQRAATLDGRVQEHVAAFDADGLLDLFEQYPVQNAVYSKSNPGLGKSAARWLAGSPPSRWSRR